MGHPYSKMVNLISKVDSTSISSSINNKSCDVCFRAKQTREVFSPSDYKAKESFDLIHCDLLRVYREPISCETAYFLIVVDYYFYAVLIYLLNRKDEVACVLKNFIVMVRRQFDKDVKIVRIVMVLSLRL